MLYSPQRLISERRIGPACFAALTLLTLTACDPGSQQACNADEDCPGALMCVENACTEPTVLNESFDAAALDTRSSRDTTEDTSRDAITPPQGDYRFVRVDDLSPTGEALDSGADIDAVIVDKASGRQAYAQAVVGYIHGGGTITADWIDPTDVTGAPDAFYAYPDLSVCDVSNGGFLSLGGLGGLLIVEMGEPIETNDIVTVLELGHCDFVEGVPEHEPIDISVSTSRDIDGNWWYLGTGSGPEVIVPVPALP